MLFDSHSLSIYFKNKGLEQYILQRFDGNPKLKQLINSFKKKPLVGKKMIEEIDMRKPIVIEEIDMRKSSNTGDSVCRTM